VDEYRRRPSVASRTGQPMPGYPMTADLSAVLAAARQHRSDAAAHAFSQAGGRFRHMIGRGMALLRGWSRHAQQDWTLARPTEYSRPGRPG